MDSDFGSVFCMCWLIPFFGTAGVVLLSHSVQQSFRARKTPDAFPRCAGCGYNLQGASKLRCPECGTFLSVHTVLIRGDNRPMSLPSRLLLWTTFLPGPAMVLFLIITAAWPETYRSTWHAALSFSHGNQTVDVTIDAQDHSIWEPGALEQFTLVIESGSLPPGTKVEVEIDTENDRMTWQADRSRTEDLNLLSMLLMLQDVQLLPAEGESRATFASTVLDLISLCEADTTTTGHHADDISQASWITRHDVDEIGKGTASVLTSVFLILLSAGVWVYGVSYFTKQYEADAERYNAGRQKVYARFRERVEGVEQSGEQEV